MNELIAEYGLFGVVCGAIIILGGLGCLVGFISTFTGPNGRRQDHR